MYVFEILMLGIYKYFDKGTLEDEDEEETGCWKVTNLVLRKELKKNFLVLGSLRQPP